MQIQKNKGIATLELLIAFALAVTLLAGATLVSFGGQTSALDARLTGKGTPKTETRQQAAVFEAFTNWAAAIAGQATTTQAGGDIYDEGNTVTDISECMKGISTGTGWVSEKNRKQYLGLQTLVGNIAAAKALEGECDPVPPGDWDNPDSYGSVDLSGADGTGVVARYINGTRYAFVTADPSAVGADDFMVVDTTDAHNLNSGDIVAQINTGPGLVDIAIGGTHAYVLQYDNADQLQVINISNPSTPVPFVPAFTLPNMVFSCGGSSKCLAGRTIAYSNHKVFIGTGYLAFGTPPLENNEFHIYDVSIPSSPSWVGSLDVNHNINDIVVRGNYAYLATSDDVGELTIVDISNPSSPIVAGKFDAQTTSGGVSDEDGWSIDVVGNYAYLGRERASNSNKRDFYILDVTNPASITIIGKMRLGIANNSYVSGISKQGNFVFLSTTDSNEPFFVIDISDPATPLIHSSCGLNFSQVTRGLFYIDNLIFTANRSNDILRVIYDQPTMCI